MAIVVKKGSSKRKETIKTIDEHHTIVKSDDDIVALKVIGVPKEDLKYATINGKPFKQVMTRKEYNELLKDQDDS